MRPLKHLTPRYMLNRTIEMINRKLNPDHPWLTRSANFIIASYLKKTDIGLEFGSGRSTIYFAQRVSFLTSVEHNLVYYNKVKSILLDNNIANVNYLFRLNDVDEDNSYNSEYVKVCNDFSQNSLDFVLVDGAYREACVNLSADKIRPGGLLILDNANYYLPCNSVSPHSRTLSQGLPSHGWANFVNNTKNWRCIWTSNGVTDTAIYLKPCQTN